MKTLLEQTDEAVRFLRERWPSAEPKIGMILGSGLGPFADTLSGVEYADASQIPNWPRSTVEGHRGRLAFGRAGSSPVLAVQGRVHPYEGYGIQEVVFPVRVLARLGLRALILTNAAGGIRPSYRAGDLVLLTDHLNGMGLNPLSGPHEPEFGERFPDMTGAYDAGLRALAESVARDLGLRVKKGVLAALPGPSYETPAEIRALRLLGADLVCMSTVPETIAARQMGLRVLGVSCVANAAAGVGPGKLSHAEVQKNVAAAAGDFGRWMAGLIPEIRT